MSNNKDEIPLDKTGKTANEDDMPGNNIVKTTDSPTTTAGVGFNDNANLNQAADPALDSSPDFSNTETKDNTNSNT